MLEVEDQLAEYAAFLDMIEPTIPVVSTTAAPRPRSRVVVAAIAVATCVALLGVVLIVRQGSTRDDEVRLPPAVSRSEVPSTVAPSVRVPAPSGCTGATPPDAAVPGCVRDEDLHLNPDERDALYAAQPIRGLPVYDNATLSTVIGYLTDTGFVPSALVSRYDDIKACNQQWSDTIHDRSIKLSASCRSLLLATGVSPEVLDLVPPTTASTSG